MGLLDDAFDGGAAMTPSDPKPCVGVFPMGTGNDLSNSLGLGLGFTKNACCCGCVCCPNSIDRIVATTLGAPMTMFDRWEALVLPGHDHAAPANDDVVNGVMDTRHATELQRVTFNNYVSLGMDAFISEKFDRWRRQAPSCHSLRAMNKLWYGVHGLTAACSAAKITADNLDVSCDGRSVPLSRSSLGSKALVVSNLPSYGGGVELWKPKMNESPRHSPTALNDGRLEVVTIGGFFHMGLLQTGCVAGDPVCQGATMMFRVGKEGLPEHFHFQADGEPFGAFPTPLTLYVRRVRNPSFLHDATERRVDGPVQY